MKIRSRHATPAGAASYGVEVTDRGRIVLPADLRRRWPVKRGERVILTLDADGVRLQRRADIVKQHKGAWKTLDPDRSWSDDLIAERRRAAVREDAE